MKHFLLILVIIVALYVAWQMSDKSERSKAARFVTHHAIRLGAFVVLLFLLLAAAMNLPSSVIF